MLNVTTTETGFPGNPKNILSFILPNASGLPGLTAIFQKLYVNDDNNQIADQLQLHEIPSEDFVIILGYLYWHVSNRG